MKRRDTIKTLTILTSGLITLPTWANGWQAKSLIIQSSTFSTSEIELLAAVADTIIPAGNSIGALSVGVDKFLQKLFTDCYDKSVQENVKKQLIYLDETSVATYGKSFVAAEQLQRQELLLKMSTGEKDKKDFFDLMKSETIRGFNTSKEVLGDRLKYKVIPGHYKGCVDVNV